MCSGLIEKNLQQIEVKEEKNEKKIQTTIERQVRNLVEYPSFSSFSMGYDVNLS